MFLDHPFVEEHFSQNVSVAASAVVSSMLRGKTRARARIQNHQEPSNYNQN